MKENTLLDIADYIEFCDRIKQVGWIVKGKMGKIGWKI